MPAGYQPDRFRLIGQRRDTLKIHILARRIDHQSQHAFAEFRFAARHHQVVDDAAVVVEQLRIALLTRLQLDKRRGHELLKKRCHGLMVLVGRDEIGLPHVRNVKEPSLLPRPQVLLHDAHGIVNGHLVTREQHHLGSGRNVALIERCPLQGLGVVGRRWAHAQAPRAQRPTIGLDAPSAGLEPPLSRNLRDWTGPRRLQRGFRSCPLG